MHKEFQNEHWRENSFCSLCTLPPSEEPTSIAIGFLAFVLLVKDEQLPGVLEQISDYAEQASEMWFDEPDNELGSRDSRLTNVELMEKMWRYGTDLVFTENGYFGITINGHSLVNSFCSL